MNKKENLQNKKEEIKELENFISMLEEDLENFGAVSNDLSVLWSSKAKLTKLKEEVNNESKNNKSSEG